MSFRRDSDQAQAWNQFVHRFQVRFEAVGIPETTFRSESAWRYFVEHQYDHEFPELLNLEHWSAENLRMLGALLDEIGEDRQAAELSGDLGNWAKRRLASAAAGDGEMTTFDARDIVADSTSSVKAQMLASAMICDSGEATIDDLLSCASLPNRAAAVFPSLLL
ncbi:MAG: hypothetical protein AAF585_07480, partial [Verrucomicrobiota bacterium]